MDEKDKIKDVNPIGESAKPAESGVSGSSDSEIEESAITESAQPAVQAENNLSAEEVAREMNSSHVVKQTAIEEISSEFSVSEALEDGAILVEEFSPHGTAHMVNGSTRISDTVVYYVMAAIYCAVGLACIFATSYVLDALSYIVGSVMAAAGVVQLIFAIKRKEYMQTKSNKTAGSLVIIGLAVMILLEHDWADSFIPVVWGVIGLFEGAHAFNHAFARISRGMRCSYYIVKGVIELVLAFLLLYEPVHHITLHIIVFGVNMVFDGITMLPIVKKLTGSGKEGE